MTAQRYDTFLRVLKNFGYPTKRIVFLGHRSLWKNKTQTAAINIVNLRTFISTWSLPEIGDILRPRSIWHAVSNYQDGGMKKLVRRKNKDWNDILSKDLNQFHFFFEVVSTRKNEKGEIRVRTPVRMAILERRNNFVSCVTWQSKNNIVKNQGPQSGQLGLILIGLILILIIIIIQ